MKLTYTSIDGRLVGEFEAKDQKGLFLELAKFMEIFEDSTKCGVCQCPHIRYVVRNVDGNEFFELHCRKPGCKARKSFGINKVGGTLFPHKKDKAGNFLPNNGWIKWCDAQPTVQTVSRTPASAVK